MVKINKYNLLLDDCRTILETYFVTGDKIYLDNDWEIVRNYVDFVNIIKSKGMPSLISFDHDLGLEKSGYDCAKWFIYYCINNDIKITSRILIHSMNNVGKKNIKSLFDTYYKYC
jgi:hypothetical protein